MFFRHDASKQGQYRRKSYTTLAIDDFKNCFSAFCISSYAKERFYFTDEEARSLLLKAFAFEKIDADPDKFVRDLMESVCVFQRDGLYLTFTHRSFQEYFSAYFISRSPSVSIGSLLDQLCRRGSDSFVPMTFDMNQMLIEREWILPRLRQINEKISAVLADDIVGYFNIFFGLDYLISGSFVDFLATDLNTFGHFRNMATRLYSPKHGRREERSSSALRARIFKLLKSRNDARVADVPTLPTEKLDPDLEFRIRLVKSDNDWLKDTWIYDYAVADRKWLKETLKRVETSNAAKEEMIGTLFD